MSTPKIVEDGTTAFEEASMNKFIAGDGIKVQIKVNYATVVEATGTLIVSPDYDSCEMVTGDFFYNTGSDTLEVTISGFVNPPHIQVSRVLGASNYDVAGSAIDNETLNIEFYDTTTGLKAEPGAINSNMNFHIFLIGY